MDKYLFISTTDVCDADYRTTVFEINNEETLKRVKEIYDKMLPIVNKSDAFEKMIEEMKEDLTDNEEDSLDDFLWDLFVMSDSTYDIDAHTLIDMKLYKVVED